MTCRQVSMQNSCAMSDACSPVGNTPIGPRRTSSPRSPSPARFSPPDSLRNLQQHTGLVHADLDHISDVVAVKLAISADARTVYAFISPRGDGLKFGVHVGLVLDDPAYKHAWQTVATEYERLYGGTWDPSQAKILVGCAMSATIQRSTSISMPRSLTCHRPTARASTTTPTALHRAPSSQIIKTMLIGPSDRDRMIQSAPMGTRHHTRLRAARLLGGYVASGLLRYEEALSALSRALEGYTEDMASALKTVVDGLAYGEASPITLEGLRSRAASLDRVPSDDHDQDPSSAARRA